MDNVEVSFEQSAGLRELFSGPVKVDAVDGISLDIEESDVVVLVGESGCGKTTLGKTAIGLQRPTNGSVRYRGQDIWDAKDGRGEVTISSQEIRRSLQIIHQDPSSALDPNHRVMPTLKQPLEKWYPELSNQDREQLIHKLLNFVGMAPPADYARRYPHQLSGGEKQRVALIRALLMDSDLILADEAISALDVSLRVDMMDLFIEIQESVGTSFLFISHNLSNAKYLADRADGRIGVMYLGELVEIGPVDQIIDDPTHPYTKALKWATPRLSPTPEAERELPLRDIDIPDPVNPPSGCRFHTRCPEAREACTSITPSLNETEDDHYVACFRSKDGHEYWASDPLDET
ncbi:ABC transporter ATP-binding protein [Halovenus marina]|uniref:ABC transporter ATP-binding protein n=1 Tax=Halovenus marina TaxID=3396621 RepID=UPI003F55023A